MVVCLVVPTHFSSLLKGLFFLFLFQYEFFVFHSLHLLLFFDHYTIVVNQKHVPAHLWELQIYLLHRGQSDYELHLLVLQLQLLINDLFVKPYLSFLKVGKVVKVVKVVKAVKVVKVLE